VKASVANGPVALVQSSGRNLQWRRLVEWAIICTDPHETMLGDVWAPESMPIVEYTTDVIHLISVEKPRFWQSRRNLIGVRLFWCTTRGNISIHKQQNADMFENQVHCAAMYMAFKSCTVFSRSTGGRWTTAAEERKMLGFTRPRSVICFFFA
jgi:hypothetical protein